MELLILLFSFIQLGEDDLYKSLLAQIWGCFILLLVMLISPLLVILARNAIATIQVTRETNCT